MSTTAASLRHLERGDAVAFDAPFGNGFALCGFAASVRFEHEGARMSLDLAHRSAHVERIGEERYRVSARESLSGLKLTLDVHGSGDELHLSACIANEGRAPLRLREIRPLEIRPDRGAELRIPGGTARARAFKNGWTVSSPAGWVDLQSGDRVLEPRVPSRLVPRWLDWMIHDANHLGDPVRGRTTSEGVLAITTQPGGAALLVGALGFRRAFTTLVVDAGAGSLAAIQWGDGAELAPGTALTLESIVVLAGSSGEELLERWASMVGERNGARVPGRRAVAWATWYAGAYTGLDEAWIDGRLKALAAAETPVDTVLIDDGYQVAHGDWLDPSPRLPSGLPALARRIRDSGFRPGIWLAPFAVAGASRVAREHPDWLVRGPRGAPLRTAMIQSYGRPTPTYSLDTTHPAAATHIEELARALVEAGFEMLKVDFLTAGAAPGARFDRGATRAAAYARGMEALRRGAGDALLVAAVSPLLANVGWIDYQRLSPDTAYGKNRWITAPQRLLNERCSPGIRNNVATTLARCFLGGRLFGSDPDAVVFDGLPAALARTLAVVNVLGAGLVAIGHDFARSRPSFADVEAMLARGPGRLRARDDGASDGVARDLEFQADSGARLLLRLNPTPGESTWRPSEAALGAARAVDVFGGHPVEAGSAIRLEPFGIAVLELQP